jgi:hypothetical protein
VAIVCTQTATFPFWKIPRHFLLQGIPSGKPEYYFKERKKELVAPRRTEEAPQDR